MKDLAWRAVNLAQMRGARYADIRIVHRRAEDLSVKNGSVESLEAQESLGFGVRVLVDGAWGFAASQDLGASAVDQTTVQAIELARASAGVARRGVDLGPPAASQGSYVTPVEIDPFTISLQDKLGVLFAADAALASEPAVDVRHSHLHFSREQKWFANTDGAFTDQTVIETGAGLQAVAVSTDDVQVRSYPTSGQQRVTGGWEAVGGWDLPGQAPRVAAEAAALLSADPCPSDSVTTVILSGDQMALQIHESCGHPAELDRAFGAEADFAGNSFLTPDRLGAYRYGSEVVNINADSTRPGGLGTFGWDDEGVPAGAAPLVRAGVFVGYLMSRETAGRLGRISNGCMRASGWSRLPLVRMTNVSLEPGTWDLPDLIADTDDGIYMETNRSWSIDDRRYNFQFGVEIGYEIKGGRLGRMLRNCTYTGLTPEFWAQCDAVCGQAHWAMWGTSDCGKGQPVQIVHTGHGAAPARFRKVRVGVLR